MLPELPHNLDDERAVLCSIFQNREAIVPIAPWLSPAHFYSDKLGIVYAAQLACFKARVTPDILNVSAELRKAGRLESAGGNVALSDLTNTYVSSYAIEDYAKRVLNYAALRQGMDASHKAGALFASHSANAEQALAEALKLLGSITAGSTDDVFQPIAGAVDSYYDRLRKVNEGELSVLGINTGYRDLDDITGGLHNDEFTILASRPSVGKTSLMLSAAFNIAQRNDTDVNICSLEMSRDQLLVRLLAMDTHIDTHRLRMFHLDEGEQALAVAALTRVAQLPIFIADISAMTADQIRLSTIRHMTKRQRPCVPFIDYLQLVGSTKHRENRVQDVSEISRSLKNLSRELHVPVVALSQLSRAVEGRASHVPMLSDLRESGSIEQDADNVWFIYREELYEPDTDKKGTAELHIAKHRNGPIGVVPFRFDAATTRFDTLSYRLPDGY